MPPPQPPQSGGGAGDSGGADNGNSSSPPAAGKFPAHWFSSEPVQVLRVRRDKACAAAAAAAATFVPRPGAMHAARAARIYTRRGGGNEGGSGCDGGGDLPQLAPAEADADGAAGPAPSESAALLPPTTAAPRWWEAGGPRLVLAVARELAAASDAAAGGAAARGGRAAAAARSEAAGVQGGGGGGGSDSGEGVNSRTLEVIAAMDSAAAAATSPATAAPRPLFQLPCEGAHHAAWVAELATRPLALRLRQLEREAAGVGEAGG